MTQQCWALVNAAGEVVSQVITDGRSPHEDGSHKGRRFREVKTERIGDLLRETLDPESGKWRIDEQKSEVARRSQPVTHLTLGELEDLVRAKIAEALA